MKGIALFLVVGLLFGGPVYAQDSKAEITADYSYLHANPQNNNICPTFLLNGSGAFYFNKCIGEFEDYGSYTHAFSIINTCPRTNAALAANGVHEKATGLNQFSSLPNPTEGPIP